MSKSGTSDWSGVPFNQHQDPCKRTEGNQNVCKPTQMPPNTDAFLRLHVDQQIPTVDGCEIHFAPPKETLVSDDSPVNTKTQWFQPWYERAKWIFCPSTLGVPSPPSILSWDSDPMESGIQAVLFLVCQVQLIAPFGSQHG